MNEEVGEVTNEQVVGQIGDAYIQYLQFLSPRQPRHHFHHPALDCRYGVEIEFLASVNRYTVGKRVNSCMFNQNGRWWRRNFDGRNPVDPSLEGSIRPITQNGNFDEFSSFFVEATENYGSKSHKGLAQCDRQGNAGQRIEHDGSVMLHPESRGFTLWSTRLPNELVDTDFRGQDWNPDSYGLQFYRISRVDPTCAQATANQGTNQTNIQIENHTWDYNGPDPVSHHLGLERANELVTNILTNDYVEYPNAIVVQPQNPNAMQDANPLPLLPVGGLLLDNLFTHMKSHKSVLVTEMMGFHVHLSLPDYNTFLKRKRLAIGFAKLFYIFEPLLFCMHPHYRQYRDYCQPIQSVLTFNEIRNSQPDLIWRHLIGRLSADNTRVESVEFISGTNRVTKSIAESDAVYNEVLQQTGNPVQAANARRGQEIHALRYLALNLANLVEGGIGTMEVRLGHSTFSSPFVQAFVNVLHNLLKLNDYLIKDSIHHAEANGVNINQDMTDEEFNYYSSHNRLLDIANTIGVIPIYCQQTSAEYDQVPQLRQQPVYVQGQGFGPAHVNVGRPIDGFIYSCPHDIVTPTQIIKRSIQLYYGLTYSIEPLIRLIRMINYYYNNDPAGQMDWLCSAGLGHLNFYEIFQQANQLFNRATRVIQGEQNGVFPVNIRNHYQPVLMRKNYHIRQYDGQIPEDETYHECSTCSVNAQQLCAPDFNYTNYPGRANQPRANANNYRDEESVYPLTCQGRTTYNKTQTELLSKRVSNNAFSGGKTYRNREKRKKTNRRTTYRKMSKGGAPPSIKVSIEFSDYKEKVVSLTKPVFQYIPQGITEGADRVLMDVQDNGVITISYGDWMGNSTPDKYLTAVANALIQQKVIPMETLNILVMDRYIHSFVWLNGNEEFQKKLLSELSRYKINEATVNAIRNVYLKQL
jgi:hypothetical protein